MLQSELLFGLTLDSRHCLPTTWKRLFHHHHMEYILHKYHKNLAEQRMFISSVLERCKAAPSSST